jgi:hypothetical protein
MKSTTIFWDAMPCSLVEVSKESTAFVFIVKSNRSKQRTQERLPDYTELYPRKEYYSESLPLRISLPATTALIET